MKVGLDYELDKLIRTYGVREVLASLCRHCNDTGMPVLFRKLNRVYEWLVDAKPAQRAQRRGAGK